MQAVLPLRLKITAKRQATFPAAALDTLGVRPGDYLTLTREQGNRWLLQPNAVDHAKLAPLRAKVAPGTPSFNLAQWRETPKNHASLRD
jgi:bifunctional DNA-binding transcriptional regulator/antitoxin component of YhaV-PrlF toxin-antitoxin module